MSIRFAAIAAALTFGPAAVQATTTIDPTSYASCLGQISCTINGTDGTVATLTALPEGETPPAEFIQQSFRGLDGLAIDFLANAPGAENEIQFSEDTPEGVRIEYSQGQVIEEIRLGHFYHAGSFGANSAEPDETALITAFSGATSVTLSVTRTADSAFTLSYSDSFAVLPTATWISSSPDQGLVSLTGLFGQLASVDKLEFFAGGPISGNDTSDYSINLTTSVIPGPFGVLLLGTAFVAAGAVRRFGAKAA